VALSPILERTRKIEVLKFPFLTLNIEKGGFVLVDRFDFTSKIGEELIFLTKWGDISAGRFIGKTAYRILIIGKKWNLGRLSELI